MYLLPYLSFCVSMTLAGWSQPGGWLDRLAQYHKEKFLNEVNELTPIKIKATIITKPAGYVDSKDWDYDSVIKLLTLMRNSEEARPVMLALRRMIDRPTRRFMTREQSFHFFPSLSKKIKNEMYYDVNSEEMYPDVEKLNLTMATTLSENSIIVLSNPVEARMPSSQISVKLLKEILEFRAQAARQMPNTTMWRVVTKSTTPGPTDDHIKDSSATTENNIKDSSATTENNIEDSSATTEKNATEET